MVSKRIGVLPFPFLHPPPLPIISIISSSPFLHHLHHIPFTPLPPSYPLTTLKEFGAIDGADRARTWGFGTSYKDMEGRGGGPSNSDFHREHFEVRGQVVALKMGFTLSKEMLEQVINNLAALELDGVIEEIQEQFRIRAEAILTISQIISESMRFINVYDAIIQNYEGGVVLSDPELLIQNVWGDLSKVFCQVYRRQNIKVTRDLRKNEYGAVEECRQAARTILGITMKYKMSPNWVGERGYDGRRGGYDVGRGRGYDGGRATEPEPGVLALATGTWKGEAGLPIPTFTESILSSEDRW